MTEAASKERAEREVEAADRAETAAEEPERVLRAPVDVRVAADRGPDDRPGVLAESACLEPRPGRFGVGVRVGEVGRLVPDRFEVAFGMALPQRRFRLAVEAARCGIWEWDLIERRAVHLDKIKVLGFHYATKAGITISKNDIVIPQSKEEILAGYEEKVTNVEQLYERGLITEEERHEQQRDAAQDERGRVRTKILVQKRSYLDGGTDVLPGERKFMDYAQAPTYGWLAPTSSWATATSSSAPAQAKPIFSTPALRWTTRRRCRSP